MSFKTFTHSRLGGTSEPEILRTPEEQELAEKLGNVPDPDGIVENFTITDLPIPADTCEAEKMGKLIAEYYSGKGFVIKTGVFDTYFIQRKSDTYLIVWSWFSSTNQLKVTVQRYQ